MLVTDSPLSIAGSALQISRRRSILTAQGAEACASLMPMSEPARRVATYEDVLASPPHVVAEVIGGVLYQHPRPAMPHAAAASVVGEELGPPFKRGRGGPGGWIILDAPEVHLGADIVVPDVGGWRRSTLPILPESAFLDVAPDWVCEVASPPTRALDRGKKLDVYQREGVKHVWFIEPLDQFVEVLELDGSTYRILQRISGDTPARLVPFDAIEFDVAALWAR
ncbi:MAG: Uma2 family endonuclease [Polyangiaceae bacterium]|nr:Uma2 family endonuclease [Polyangiaceae bacterium]